jgi:hypothetical protein
MAGLSELQAVNLMLSNIGELPVPTLVGGSGDAYVSTCQAILGETTRSILGRGWDFNTDTNYEMSPDVNSQVLIADNIINVDTCAGGLNVAVRQGKLYNKFDHTFLFTEPLFTDVIWEFTFEETPQYIRQYIAIAAARVFSGRMQGDIANEQLTIDDEDMAKANAKQADNRNTDSSMLQAPSLARLSRRI